MERNPMTARLALSGPALASLHGRTVVQLGAPTHQADVPFFLSTRHPFLDPHPWAPRAHARGPRRAFSRP